MDANLMSEQKAIRKIERTVVWLKILTTLLTLTILIAWLFWPFLAILPIAPTIVEIIPLIFILNLILGGLLVLPFVFSAWKYIYRIIACLQYNKEDLAHYYTHPKNQAIRDHGSLLYWTNKFLIE